MLSYNNSAWEDVRSRALHPTILAKLKPFNGTARDMWKFAEHLHNNENLHLPRECTVPDKIRFALANCPEAQRASARRHLVNVEQQFFAEQKCVACPDQSLEPDVPYVHAPLTEAYMQFASHSDQLDWPQLPTYKLYRRALVEFITGVNGLEQCRMALSVLRQGADEPMQRHLANFDNHLGHYAELNAGQPLEESLRVRLLYKSIQSGVLNAMRELPRTFEAAKAAIASAARTVEWRRLLGTQSEFDGIRSKATVHNVQPAACNLRGQPVPTSSWAKHNCVHPYEKTQQIGELLDGAPNGTQYMERLCNLCGVTPSWSAVAQATSLEKEDIRDSVGQVFATCQPFTATVHAIKNLIPSRFIQTTNSTRESQFVYDNLDKLSQDDLRERARRQREVDNLRGPRSGDYDDDEEEAAPPKKQRRVTRSSSSVHALGEVDPESSVSGLLAFYETCHAISADIDKHERQIRLCHHCHKEGHYYRQCPDLVKQDGSVKLFCPFCKAEHRLDTCEKLKGVECRFCKNKGHTSRYCPDNPSSLLRSQKNGRAFPLQR